MAQYLYIGSYTADGASGVLAEGGEAREQETRKLFESLGGKVLFYAFAFGDFDFLIIAELEDDNSALVPPMLASTTGTVSVKTTKLVKSQDMSAIAEMARNAKFRAAGAD